MGNDQTVCGGRLEDGSECKASVWNPEQSWWEIRETLANGEVRRGGLRSFADKLTGPRHCLQCGTRLGVTADGEPTREAMVPESELEETKTHAEDLQGQLDGNHHELMNLRAKAEDMLDSLERGKSDAARDGRKEHENLSECAADKFRELLDEEASDD